MKFARYALRCFVSGNYLMHTFLFRNLILGPSHLALLIHSLVAARKFSPHQMMIQQLMKWMLYWIDTQTCYYMLFDAMHLRYWVSSGSVSTNLPSILFFQLLGITILIQSTVMLMFLLILGFPKSAEMNFWTSATQISRQLTDPDFPPPPHEQLRTSYVVNHIHCGRVLLLVGRSLIFQSSCLSSATVFLLPWIPSS